MKYIKTYPIFESSDREPEYRVSSEELTPKIYYHFSKAKIELGKVVYSNVCKDRIYLERVVPAYTTEAARHGKEWPIQHGYAYAQPIFWIYGSSQFRDADAAKAEVRAGMRCYVLSAIAPVLSGPSDWSAQVCTMLGGDRAELFARNYFRRDFDQSRAEWISSGFVVQDMLAHNQWRVGFVDEADS
jgi:hypothetical protein